MKNLIHVLVLVFVGTFLKAQEKENIAVLFNKMEAQTINTKILQDSIKSKLNKSKKMDFDFFVYDEKSKTITPLDEGSSIKYSKKIFIVDQKVEYNKNPRVRLSYNEESKIHTASFPVEFKITIQDKLIDIATSNVDLMDNQIYDLKDDFLKSEMSTSSFDVTKEIKGKAPAIGSKEYKALTDKLNKIAAKKLLDIQMGLLKSEADVVRYTTFGLLSSLDDRLFNISPVEGKKNMGSFMIDAGRQDDIAYLDDLRVIKKTQIGEYSCGEYIGTAVVKKRENNQSKCGFLLSGGKKLKEAYESNETVYAVRNRKLINGLDEFSSNTIKIAVDTDCLFCDASYQEMLLRVNGVSMIERNHKFILDYFLPKYKTEKYIDFDVENVIGKQEGVDYILTSQKANAALTDVATSQVNTISRNATTYEFKQFMVDLFKEDIKVIHISKRSKKNTIKKMIVYSPYGFQNNDIITTYSVTIENVGGKEYERKELLGTAQVVKKYSDNIVEIVIYKKQKQITEIIDSDGKIVFGYLRNNNN